MVAPSYQKYIQIGDPYTVSGKMYVRLRHPSTGNERQARWYTEAEYNKLYPAAAEEMPRYTFQKKIFGFDKEYIYIFKGITSSNEEWFEQHPRMRYCTYWGWFMESRYELPALPEGVEAVQLPWVEVGDSDGALRPETAVKNAVNALLYGISASKWQGSVGERITRTLVVIKNIPVENQYGQSHVFVFKDEEQNEYSWVTATKNYPVGTVITLKGTVKEHVTKYNTQSTILTRCTEVK